MGYRGKVAERERARELRAQAWTYAEIVAELGVARSSVSLWVRDVPFDESARAARAGMNRNQGAQNRGPTSSPAPSRPRSRGCSPRAASGSAN